MNVGEGKTHGPLSEWACVTSVKQSSWHMGFQGQYTPTVKSCIFPTVFLFLIYLFSLYLFFGKRRVLLLKKKRKKKTIGHRVEENLKTKEEHGWLLWVREMVYILTSVMVIWLYIYQNAWNSMPKSEYKFIKVFWHVTSPYSSLYEKDNNVN